MELSSMNNNRPKLTHVAIRFQGKIWSLPAPYRHFNIIRVICFLNPEIQTVETNYDTDQGFLDESGRYLTRKQAEVNAFLNNQVKHGKMIGSCLTSEDLW